MYCVCVVVILDYLGKDESILSSVELQFIASKRFQLHHLRFHVTVIIIIPTNCITYSVAAAAP